MKRGWTFFETRDAKRVWELCDLCYREREIGVVYGAAGVGKTESLRMYYYSHRENCAYVQVPPYIRMRQFFLLLARELGIYVSGYQSTDRIVEHIRARLEGRPDILVIIDEADNLSITTLDTLRYIYDQKPFGLVLAGLPRLIGLLALGPERRENLAQLYTRIAYPLRVHGPTRKEMQEILKVLGIEDEGAQEAMIEEVQKAPGSFRRFHKLYKRALYVAEINKQSINQKIITTVSKQMSIFTGGGTR